MKWMIASDLHGNWECVERLLARYRQEGAQMLLLLGDLLYPKGADTVAALLNPLKNEIICVRGNCDSLADQRELEFPMLDETRTLTFGTASVFASHGDRYHSRRLPPMGVCDILLFGHTHVPECTKTHGVVCMNPGSVSRPRGGSTNSYMTWEKDVFLGNSLEGETLFQYVWTDKK